MFLVLHHHQCINEWVEDVAGKDNKASGVAVNWAFFTPEGPKLSDLGRSGNLKLLSSNDTNRHKVIKHIHNDLNTSCSEANAKMNLPVRRYDAEAL